MRINALEAIDSQFNSKFIELLLNEITNIRQYGVTDSLVQSSKLSSIIKDFIGVNTRFKVSNNFTCELPDINKNNPILLNAYRYMLNNTGIQKFIARKGIFDGTVDLKQGKVSGDFSELLVIINLDEQVVNDKSNFSDKEILAILLHELGHSLVFFEMLNRTTMTNYIMSDATKALVSNSSNKEQRVTILGTINDFYGGLSNSEIEQITTKSRDEKSYQVLILQMAVQQSYSQLNDNIYDAKAFERMADWYVNKFGYGVHIVTALDKLNRIQGSSSLLPTPLYYMAMLATALGIVGLPLAMSGKILLVLLFSLSDSTSSYDPMRSRFEKIRQSYIERLKDKRVRNEERLDILNAINTIDILSKEVYNNLKFWELLDYGLFGKKKKIIETQQKLESLLNNDLVTTQNLLDTKLSQ